MSLSKKQEYRLRNLHLSTSLEGYLRNFLCDIRDLEGLDDGLKILLSERAWRVTDHCQLANWRRILDDFEDAIEEGLPVVIPEELIPIKISDLAIIYGQTENMEQLGNQSGGRIETNDIYTPEQADGLRNEDSAQEDASLQNRATTIDLHVFEVIGSEVDQDSKASIATELSWGVETPALDDSGHLCDDNTPAQVKQTKIRKKEPTRLDAVSRIDGLIDLHDREVIDGGILAQVNMTYAKKKKKKRKKEPTREDAVLQIHRAIDLHDREVIDGGILAHANMVCTQKKIRPIVDREISADINPKTLGAAETKSVLPSSLERTVPAAPNISWRRHRTPQKIFDPVPEVLADENIDDETCGNTSRMDAIVCLQKIPRSWFKMAAAPSRTIEPPDHTVACCRCFQGTSGLGGPRRIGVDYCRPPPAPNIDRTC